VVGSTGIWVVESWQRRRLPLGGAALAAAARGLRWQADAIAEVLDGPARIPVRSLLCVHGSWPGTPRPVRGSQVAAPRQLAGVVRSGPRAAPGDIEVAAARLLEVLRPAA
jgi:hypothetical protein